MIVANPPIDAAQTRSKLAARAPKLEHRRAPRGFNRASVANLFEHSLRLRRQLFRTCRSQPRKKGTAVWVSRSPAFPIRSPKGVRAVRHARLGAHRVSTR